MKKIKIYFKSFFRSKFLVAVILSGLLLNLIAWIIFWIGLDFDKTALILHYNSFFGIDKIAINSDNRHFLNVFFVAFSGLLVMIVNYLLGLFLVFSSEKNEGKIVLKDDNFKKLSVASLGGYFLLVAGTILQVVIIVYTIAIFLVNR